MQSFQITVPTLVIIQGDTTGVYTLKSTSEDFSSDDWSCKMVLRQTDVNGDIVLTKMAPYSADAEGFNIMFTGSEMSLPPGEYFLAVEIYNKEFFFRREVFHTEVYIRPQGVPNQ